MREGIGLGIIAGDVRPMEADGYAIEGDGIFVSTETFIKGEGWND